MCEFTPLIADVGDEPRMREIFARFRPEVIFHAAAHKHVPLMEANTAEAIKNNVLATRCVGKLAGEFGARDFVLISTDKAVNPTSVMGASKRIAEIVVQGLNCSFETTLSPSDSATCSVPQARSFQYFANRSVRASRSLSQTRR